MELSGTRIKQNDIVDDIDYSNIHLGYINQDANRDIRDKEVDG